MVFQILFMQRMILSPYVVQIHNRNRTPWEEKLTLRFLS